MIQLWSCIGMAALFFSPSIFCLLVLAQKDESAWTCESDGHWYEYGYRTEFTLGCGSNSGSGKSGSSKSGSGKSDSSKDDWDKSGTGKDESSKDTGSGDKTGWSNMNKDSERCTVTSDYNMPSSLPQTCISHSSNPDGRCWWTYVPNEVTEANDGRKVPLVVDMHGGGGCASDRYQSSGFKALSDTEASIAGSGMVVVWPNGGPSGLWTSQGTSDRQTNLTLKPLPQWDDIDFLEKLIAYMIKSSPQMSMIDPERIYVSGFSQGCMMAHRFSMERSKIVAALGCHGGELSFYPTDVMDMDSDKSTYDIQPMPAYLTIGTADGWYGGAQRSFQAWAYWNGCTSNGTNSLATDLDEVVASSCETYTPELQTIMLVIAGGLHMPDTRATEKSWLFMKEYKRNGVLAELPEAPSEISPPAPRPQPQPRPRPQSRPRPRPRPGTSGGKSSSKKSTNAQKKSSSGKSSSGKNNKKDSKSSGKSSGKTMKKSKSSGKSVGGNTMKKGSKSSGKSSSGKAMNKNSKNSGKKKVSKSKKKSKKMRAIRV